MTFGAMKAELLHEVTVRLCHWYKSIQQRVHINLVKLLNWLTKFMVIIVYHVQNVISGLKTLVRT